MTRAERAQLVRRFAEWLEREAPSSRRPRVERPRLTPEERRDRAQRTIRRLGMEPDGEAR